MCACVCACRLSIICATRILKITTKTTYSMSKAINSPILDQWCYSDLMHWCLWVEGGICFMMVLNLMNTKVIF